MGSIYAGVPFFYAGRHTAIAQMDIVYASSARDAAAEYLLRDELRGLRLHGSSTCSSTVEGRVYVRRPGESSYSTHDVSLTLTLTVGRRGG
jgi:hypothetical protein